MALRELIAEFGVKFDSSELDRGNKSIEGGIGKLKAFGAAIAASAIVVGIKNMVTGLAEEADALAKQSSMLGLSIQEMQEWRHAAGLSGVSSQELQKSFLTLSKQLEGFRDGTKSSVELFNKLKIKDPGTMTIGDAFESVGERLAELDDETKRNALSMEIFGKSGAKLFNLFKEGPEGVKRLRAEVEALGGGFSPEFAKNAEEMNDNISRLDFASTSLKVTISSFLLPAISRMAIGSAKVIASFSKWVKESGLVEGAAVKLKAAVAWLGAMGVAKLVKLAGGFKSIAKIIARFALTFLLPILAFDELITFFMGGDTIIGRAIDRMFGDGSAKKVRDFAIGAFNEIKGLLARIVTAFKMDGFDKIKALFPELSDGWSSFLAGLIVTLQTSLALIVALFTGDTEKIGAAFDYLGTWLEAIALELDAPFVMAAMGIADAFAGAWNAIISGAQSVLSTINEVIDKVPGGRKLLDAFAGGAGSALKAGPQALEGLKAGTGRAADMQGQYDASRLDIAGRMDQAATRFAGGSTVSAPTTVNVTVPPGTPAAQARAVGNAAAAGASRGNRATLAAVKKVAPG